MEDSTVLCAKISTILQYSAICNIASDLTADAMSDAVDWKRAFGQQYQNWTVRVYETSAKTGEGINDAFEDITRRVYRFQQHITRDFIT